MYGDQYQNYNQNNYQGGAYDPQDRNEYGRRTFLGGLNNLAPWGKENPWGNPVDSQQEDIEAVTGRASDSAAWFGQRIAMPFIAGQVGNSLSNALGFSWKQGAAIGSKIGSGLGYAVGGKSSPFGGIRATGTALKTAFQTGGFNAAFDAAGSIGIRGGINLAARGVGAGAGALGAMFAPSALAVQAGITLGEKGIWDPYVNTRQSFRDLRNNYASQYFSDAQGNEVTGKGLSNKEAYSMASQITSQGIQDMSLTTGQYRQAAGSVMASGLTDNVSATGISKRIKESISQAKLIMAVASMPEISEAIEVLAKFQQSGASVNGGYNSVAAGSINKIGALAAAAGTSVKALMTTVGAQGQQMYQANGMTPYLGQLAAANAYSAAAAGERTGLLGDAQLARMGGLQGMTQSSLGGQMSVSMSNLNRMALSNAGAGIGTQYNGRSGAVGTITAFGQRASRDPLGSYGDMLLYSKQRAAEQIDEQGTKAVEDQLMTIAKNVPGAIGRNGKITAEKAAPLLQQMGMSEDQIHAFLAQYSAEKDDKSYQQQLRGVQGFTKEQQREYISQTGTYGGVVGGTIYQAKKAGRAFTDAMQSVFVKPVLGATGSVGDAVQRGVDQLWFGTSIDKDKEKTTIEDLLGPNTDMAKAKSNVSLFKEGTIRGVGGDNAESAKQSERKAAGNQIGMKINDLAKENNTEALAYLNATDPAEKQKRLYKLIDSEALGKDEKERYHNTDEFANLNTYLGSAARDKSRDLSKPEEIDTSTWYGKAQKYLKEGFEMGSPYAKKAPEMAKADKFKKDLASAAGFTGKDELATSKGVGLAFDIASRADINPGNIDDLMKSDKSLQEYSKLIGEKDGLKLLQHAKESAVNARETGLVAFGTVANQINTKGMTKEQALGAIANANGGIYQNAIKNAKDITQDEAINGGVIERDAAKQKAHLAELHKAGRIDTQAYEQIQSQEEYSKSTKQFSDAVDAFVKGVETTTGKSVAGNNNGSGVPDLPGSGWQRIVDGARSAITRRN